MPALQLIRRSNELIEVRLASDLPEHISFFGSVALAEPICGSTTLTVIDMGKAQDRSSWTWQPKFKYPNGQAILTSNLQKAVRRAEVEAALATARQLLWQDTAGTLRRLAIILLEDSVLQPNQYTQIVWLMVAISKGYSLSVVDVQTIMDGLATALTCERRYDLEEEGGSAEEPLIAAYVAIRIRGLSGGMKFDTEFLGSLADRFAYLDKEDEPMTVEMDDIPEFDPKEHLLPAAIDFHCCRQLLEYLKLETGIKPTEAKDAIWWHRSSVNVRTGPESLTIREEAYRLKTAQIWGRIAVAATTFADRVVANFASDAVAVERLKTLDNWFKPAKQPKSSTQ